MKLEMIAAMGLAMLGAAPALAQQDAPQPPTGATQPISKADFLAAARVRMMKADSNGDGKVSAAEWSAAMQAREGGEGGGRGGFGERMFTRLDANQDGFVDGAEIDAASAQRFDRQDSNGDGVLTEDERQAARDRMMGARGERGGQ